MFNLFPPRTNQHYRDVHVISSRKPTEVVRCYSDEPICPINALKAVEATLPPSEPGEVKQLKTFFG
ncbi:hypothetical protein QUA56_33605 [Microcoleus sp. N3A4]|uniref:hypothetical protein n=1 Tax=Microcoleus sp. N3A4 TaxID=3055379 RepID=UPI002FD16804